MLKKVFGGVRPVDVVLAVVLVALAALLSVAGIETHDEATRIDSHSWWQLPVNVLSALPILWWRRGLLAVLGASCLALAVHLVAFGALVRCGSGLPLLFVYAFLAGYAYPDLRRRLGALGLAFVLATLVMVRDTAAGVELLPVVILLASLIFAIGRVVAHRAELAAQLRSRNEELRRLRDERAALEVNDERAQLSARLEVLLDQRLSQLAAVAEQGAADPARAAGTLATLEAESRRTLGDMREIVGLLRGGEVSLAPTPSVAHLDALLARRLHSGSRLRVAGDPRVLPASVELSAYRIVEHLVTALADDPTVPVGVTMQFADDALELRVSGPVDRGGDLRGAVNRARERARLHAGSLDVKVTRGKARVTAHLPVLSGA